MHEGYCFECGSYTGLDDFTKLCDRCYRAWWERRQFRR